MTTAKTNTPVPFSASSKSVKSQSSPLEREFILESERDESAGKASPIEGIMEKGSETMATTQAQRGSFEDYNKLFDLLCQLDDRIEIESVSICETYVLFEGNRWTFVIYPPERVASFRQLASRSEDPEIQKAYEQGWGLLETCKGGFKDPQYTPLAPNVDVYELKKKWCRDYCQFHGIGSLIKDVSEEETHASPKAEEGV